MQDGIIEWNGLVLPCIIIAMKNVMGKVNYFLKYCYYVDLNKPIASNKTMINKMR